MFLRSEKTRIKNPFLEVDQYGWSKVDLMLYAPLYFCRYIDYMEGGEFTTTSLLSRVFQLRDLSNMSHVTIKDVYLISPGHKNNTEGWLMGKVSKIFVSRDHESKNGPPVYKIIKNDGAEIFVDECFEVDDEQFSYEMILDLG